MHTHAHAHTCEHTRTHARMHTRTHAHTRTRTHVRTRIRTHTYTREKTKTIGFQASNDKNRKSKAFARFCIFLKWPESLIFLEFSNPWKMSETRDLGHFVFVKIAVFSSKSSILRDFSKSNAFAWKSSNLQNETSNAYLGAFTGQSPGLAPKNISPRRFPFAHTYWAGRSPAQYYGLGSKIPAHRHVGIEDSHMYVASKMPRIAPNPKDPAP